MNGYLSKLKRNNFRQDPWWHMLGLLSGLAFAAMLMVARLYQYRFTRIDAAFESVVKPFQTFGHAEFFLIVTVLGSGLGDTVLAIGASYFLRNNKAALIRLVSLLVFVWLSMSIAKAFVERARPDVLSWLVPLHSYSFPSGHASLSTAFYGFIAVCLYRRSSTAIGRFLSILVPILIILLVCLSRIVLGYHYFTDVVAGVLLGSFWLAFVFMLPISRSGFRHVALGRISKGGRAKD